MFKKSFCGKIRISVEFVQSTFISYTFRLNFFADSLIVATNFWYESDGSIAFKFSCQIGGFTIITGILFSKANLIVLIKYSTCLGFSPLFLWTVGILFQTNYYFLLQYQILTQIPQLNYLHYLSLFYHPIINKKFLA